jgi:N-acetylmuramoyl-L-alanine amidase
MRSLFTSLFLLAAIAATARAPLQKLERTTVSGSDYIRLGDWANSAGFHMNWNRTEGVVVLTSSTGRVDLTVDSRRAEIRGVTVWLSLPVINRNGSALISLVDATTTLEPILFPPRTAAHLTTVCLDPGHGGKDTGEISKHNFEKTYALLLAREVGSLLEQAGLKVVLTRKSDEFIELPERPLLARRQGADLFVSIHYNSAVSDIRGLEVYCLAPAGVNSSNEGGGRAPRLPEAGNRHDSQNALLAYEVQKAVTTGTRMEDRGVKRSRFEVLREAVMPAILIEGGFMSNPSEARNIYDSTFRRRMAQAIVDGILAYKRTVEGT